MRNYDDSSVSWYRQGVVSLAVAFMLTFFGLSSIGYALMAQQPPPAPPASNRQLAVQGRDTELQRSEPRKLVIPDIQVDAPLIQTGLLEDGTPEVPAGEEVDMPSWMKTSVTPGEKGTSVLLGHVDSVRSGPSVFFNLGTLTPGQQVSVHRADGTTAVFTVTSVRSFDRQDFPLEEIYADRDYAALHLITCGGVWDEQNQRYDGSVVAFTRLTSVR